MKCHLNVAIVRKFPGLGMNRGVDLVVNKIANSTTPYIANSYLIRIIDEGCPFGM